MASQYKRSAPAEEDSFDDGFTFKKSRNSEIFNERQNGGSTYIPSPKTLEEITGFLNQVMTQNKETPSKPPYPMIKREQAVSPSHRARWPDPDPYTDIKDLKPLAINFDDDEHNLKDNTWNPGRRSSFMSRSKQQSSFSRTSIAFPHPHLESKNYYKHIMPDLPDPVRMRQLLAWCGNNLMDSSDPKKDKKQSKADSIAYEIQKRILGQLKDGKINTSWYTRAPVSNPMEYKRKPNPRNQRNMKLVEKYERTAGIMEKEDKAWKNVAMKLNNFHAGVLDSCPPLPKSMEKDAKESDNSLKTHFQQYYLEGISQEQLQFLNKYCTPSSTDDIDSKITRTVESLQAKVDQLQESLTAKLHDQRAAEKFGKEVLEKLSSLLDKREGVETDISEEHCCPLPDTIEVLRVLANENEV